MCEKTGDLAYDQHAFDLAAPWQIKPQAIWAFKA